MQKMPFILPEQKKKPPTNKQISTCSKMSFMLCNFTIADRQHVICHSSPFQILSTFDLTSGLIYLTF